MTERRKGRRGGFTLVEVLVGMTLLALVTTMVFEGLWFGARTWDRVRVHGDRTQQISQVHAFLRDRIGAVALRAGPEGRSTLPAETRALLHGTERSVEFIAPWVPRFATYGRFRFTLRYDEAAQAIGLRWQPVDAAGGLGAEGERVLLDGVPAARFQYYGSASKGERPEWHDAWSGVAGLPLLIGVDFGPEVPVLQIAIRAQS